MGRSLHSRKAASRAILAIAAAGGWAWLAAAHGAVYLVDLGSERGNANNVPGQAGMWNFINAFSGTHALSDTGGMSHGISMALSGFNGQGGSTWTITDASLVAASNALGYLSNTNASRDGLFVNPGNIATLTLSGLIPQMDYTISLFASRSNTDARYTFYTASGNVVLTNYVQTSGSGAGQHGSTNLNWNNDTIAQFTLRPNASSQIVIQVVGRSGPHLSSAFNFGYLNSFQLTWSVPEPSTAVLFGLALAALAHRRRNIFNDYQ